MLEQVSCKKQETFALFDNCFSDLYTEVEISYSKYFTFVLGRFLER